MISTILCCIDGSEQSDNAVQFAADLAGRYKAKLVLFHVYMRNLSVKELSRFVERADLKDIVQAEINRMNGYVTAVVGAYHTSGYMPAPAENVVTSIAEVLLADAQRIAGAQPGIEIECVTGNGDPAQAILTQIDEQSADLVVMGSRGLGAFKGILQGSVSQKVNHHAHCTCVLVK